MSAPTWLSQRYPPDGAVAGEGIRNQLGRPELDLLTILVRESAQNSWDARIDDATSVDYRIDLTTVSAAAAPVWRRFVLNGAPAESNLPLRKPLQAANIRVMSISDRGSKGLGGPTRADRAVGDNRDFVRFLRNVGESGSGRALGGGTYGFGKGIFYLVARSGAVLVYTRCRFEGRLETRLMGAALGKSYLMTTQEGTCGFTGRHWWGKPDGQLIEPLLNDEADAFARLLGMPLFEKDQTGTTITMIDPDLDEYEPRAAAQFLADTIAWQLWPKIVPNRSGLQPMRVTVTCDGITYPVSDPESTPPLSYFVDAFRKLDEGGSTPLWCQRPKRLLGHLGLEKRTVLPVAEMSAAAQNAGFEGNPHHVCLMRPAELVVKYWVGPKPASEMSAYAGVFRADGEMAEIYANAEPPTHDDWNYQSLKDSGERRCVNTTFTRLRETIERAIELNKAGHTPVADISLGAASDLFSPLVGGRWGIGGATDYGRPGYIEDEVDLSELDFPGIEGDEPADTTHGDADFDKGEPGSPMTGFEPKMGGTGNGVAGSDPADQVAPDRRGGRNKKMRPRLRSKGRPYLDEFSGMAVLIQEFLLPVPVLQRVRAELAVALSEGAYEVEPPEGAPEPKVFGWIAEDGTVEEVPELITEGGDKLWKLAVIPASDTMTDIVIRVEVVD